jgi:hypothetical protein
MPAVWGSDREAGSGAAQHILLPKVPEDGWALIDDLAA